MPTRLLREGILDSDRVCQLSFPAEVFYRRLMSVVDDFGRFDGRFPILRSRLYSLQIDKVREADIERWIAECVKSGLIALYSVSGKPYILFFNLGDPRAKDSKYPPPPPELEVSPQLTSANVCKQTQTDENRREQMKASVPDSDSDSDTHSDSDKPPNPPPAGGGVETKPKRVRGQPQETVPIPASLDTPEFRAAWADWLADRVTRKKPVTPLAAKSQLADLETIGPKLATECVRESIRNGWQGIFTDKYKVPHAGGGSRCQTKAERDAEYLAEELTDAFRSIAAKEKHGPATSNAPVVTDRKPVQGGTGQTDPAPA